MNKIECPVAAQRNMGARRILETTPDNTTEEDRVRRDLRDGDRYNRIACKSGACTVRAAVSLSSEGRVAISEVINPATCIRNEQPTEPDVRITFSTRK